MHHGAHKPEPRPSGPYLTGRPDGIVRTGELQRALWPFPERASVPRTSAAAPRRRGGRRTQRDKILDFIRSRGPHGATDEECQDALELPVQSETPRRGELATAGLIRDSGRLRPTRRKCMATVWIATDRGQQ